MWKARSVIHGATILSLVLGGFLALSGCGSDAAGTSGSHPPTTEEEKARVEAQRKATEEAYKDFSKTQKKKSTAPKGGRMSNGQRTS